MLVKRVPSEVPIVWGMQIIRWACGFSRPYGWVEDENKCSEIKGASRFLTYMPSGQVHIFHVVSPDSRKSEYLVPKNVCVAICKHQPELKLKLLCSFHILFYVRRVEVKRVQKEWRPGSVLAVST